MESLRRLAWYNSRRGVHRVTGGGVGNGLYPNRRTDGAGSAGGNVAGREDIEIHIIPGGDNGGVVVGSTGRESSPTFSSGNSAGGSIDNMYIGSGQPGRTGVVTNGRRIPSGSYSNLGNGGIGVPDMEYTNTGSSVIGRRTGVPGAGIAGRGGSASEVRGGGNLALGSGGVGGSLDRYSGLAAGIVGSRLTGNGGRNLDGGSNSRASISGVVAATSRHTGGGGRSAAVVGVVGARATTHGGGIGLSGESRGFTNGNTGTISSRIMGAGSVVTNEGTPSSNNVDVSSGTIGITGHRSGVPGIGGVSNAFSSAVSRIRGRSTGGSTGRAGATSFAEGNNMRDDSYFGPDVDDNENLNPEFDDAEEAGRRSTYSTRFHG